MSCSGRPEHKSVTPSLLGAWSWISQIRNNFTTIPETTSLCIAHCVVLGYPCVI
jgi:hypothetical protein